MPQDKRRMLNTYDIRTGILGGQNLTGLGGRDLELGDDGDGLDLGGPGELDVVADAVRGRRGLDARVDAALRGGQHLAEGDLLAGDVLGGQGLEVGADEAAEEGGADVVRVALDHEAVVEQALWGQVVEVADLLAELDTGDDGGARRAQTPAERDGVLDVHMGLDGEAALVVAA